MAEVMDLQMGLVQGDAVCPQVLKESDIIVKIYHYYYPDDQTASRYQVVALKSEHNLLIIC